MTFKIGIDVGGTFTDLFLWSSDGAVETYKTLSTPEDPSIGVLTGLRTIADARGLDVDAFAAQIATIVHGTTVTTNATLTRGGAKTGLLTTEGVRDALEMRRGIREKQYDNHFQNVVPLVPRYLRRGIPGRLDYQGREVTPVDLEQVREAAQFLKKSGVEAVAICFMNSFANPAHEHAAAEIVNQELPDAYLSVSSDLMPTVRFYNRVSTTVLNSYVGPILRGYLSNLTAKLSWIGFKGVLLIMQSNGGVAVPEVTLEQPATTLLSGPAAGPCAAAAYAKPHGHDDCIVVDMGGTSFDTALVRGGVAATNNEGEIDRLRIALPMLAITTIGAGGGSIGWIDHGGLLRMGPRSAGASPGPACYGRGGEEPACTDANLILGYLDPTFFAGGKLTLDRDAAARAIDLMIAKPLGMSVEEAAAGMYRVINTNMAHGVREITVKRGLDPREFPMVVAGGGGALHACMIANELEMPKLLVPSTASVLCATGMLMSDLQHDFVRSYISRFDQLDMAHLKSLVDEMKSAGAEQLRFEGVSAEHAAHEIALDLRYLKQYHEVTVTVPESALTADGLAEIAVAFHREHDRLFGYELSEESTTIELINVRVRSWGRTDKPTIPALPEAGPDPERARKGTRRAFLPETIEFADVPIYDGHLLEAGNRIAGPALIERTDTTILVTRSFTAEIDRHGTCVLNRKEA